MVRAVQTDLSRGDTTHALDRLVAVHKLDLAADVLATEGVRLVMEGQGPAIAAFVTATGRGGSAPGCLVLRRSRALGRRTMSSLRCDG